MRYHPKTLAGISLAACLVLAGCQAPVETTTLDKDLGEADLKSFAVGSTWLGLRNGEEHTSAIIAKAGGEVTIENSRGCSYTRDQNIFAPSTSFANCNGNTGTQTISQVEGEIWPLKLGKSQSWSLTGKNRAGDNWETTRRCEVESVERVSVPAGEFDTYKVVCRDSWRTRTWYYAPSANSTVLFVNQHRKRNSTTKWELVSSEIKQ